MDHEVEAFGAKLERRSGLRVEWVDEGFSTAEAESRLKASEAPTQPVRGVRDLRKGTR